MRCAICGERMSNLEASGEMSPPCFCASNQCSLPECREGDQRCMKVPAKPRMVHPECGLAMEWVVA